MTDRAPSCFLCGERIDLHAVTEDSIPEWASWFNDPNITRYLPEGLFPNTIEDQKRFIARASEVGRFLAHVRSKSGQLLGVVSLSDVDYDRRSCQFATVMPIKDPDAPYATQEAICLITEHAFRTLDMDRVWAGLVYPGNVRLSHALELIGYVTEGVHRVVGRIDREPYDAIRIAITYNDFQRIAERRGGTLWPGERAMKEMFKALSDHRPCAETVDDLLVATRREQDEWLASIDADCLPAS